MPLSNGKSAPPSATISRAQEEYLAAVEAGAAPPRDEFLARHAELAEDLDACLEALRFIGRAAEGPLKVAAEAIDVSGAGNHGEADERVVLRKALEPDRCYVLDRGDAQFALFNAIVAAGSRYVCRVRDNSVYEVLEARPLTPEAQQARVTFDAVVRLGRERRQGELPRRPLRLVLVQTTPHPKRGKRGKRGGGTAGPRSDGVVRIATNRLYAPAEVIAFIYQQRWTMESFFRFLKHILGCRRLLSTDPVGIEIQAYCALIACLLIALWTGKKPTKRTYERICFYFIGWADEEELLAHLKKRQAQDA